MKPEPLEKKRRCVCCDMNAEDLGMKRIKNDDAMFYHEDVQAAVEWLMDELHKELNGIKLINKSVVERNPLREASVAYTIELVKQAFPDVIGKDD